MIEHGGSRRLMVEPVFSGDIRWAYFVANEHDPDVFRAGVVVSAPAAIEGRECMVLHESMLPEGAVDVRKYPDGVRYRTVMPWTPKAGDRVALTATSRLNSPRTRVGGIDCVEVEAKSVLWIDRDGVQEFTMDGILVEEVGSGLFDKSREMHTGTCVHVGHAHSGFSILAHPGDQVMFRNKTGHRMEMPGGQVLHYVPSGMVVAWKGAAQ